MQCARFLFFYTFRTSLLRFPGRLRTEFGFAFQFPKDHALFLKPSDLSILDGSAESFKGFRLLGQVSFCVMRVVLMLPYLYQSFWSSCAVHLLNRILDSAQRRQEVLAAQSGRESSLEVFICDRWYG